MYQLTADQDFEFEIVRPLGLAPYEGADVGEVLSAIKGIKPGDMESFIEHFYSLATHVHSQAKAIDSCRHPVSARNAFFRAATYYRAADMYLHGNESDPRIESYWKEHRSAYDNALRLMDVPGKRVDLKTKQGNVTIPAIFYAAAKHYQGPRPTILLVNGYDGAQEESYHFLGKAALERGFNVITYEGPGQPTVRREQDLGFIPDWETIGMPVVDYAMTLPQVDASAIAVMGISLGGYLATRIAAFDERVAAVVAIDGVYDFYETGKGLLDPRLVQLLESGNKTAFNEAVDRNRPQLLTVAKWALDQGLWTFKTPTAYDYYMATKNYTLKGLTDKIKAPVFVGDAQQDMFFLGQPQEVAKHLGDKATLYSFNTTDSAHLHCSEGATVYLNSAVYDWLEDVFAKK